MLCSVYTSIAGEYDGPPFWTPIGTQYYWYKIQVCCKCIINKILVEIEIDYRGDTPLVVEGTE